MAQEQPPRGVIAIDKVSNKVRFYDPVSFAETKVLDGPEPCVHELAVAPDRKTAFVPLYGDGIYGSNKNPNHKVLAIDLERREIASIIDLGERYPAPHGMVALSDGSLWVVCDLAGMLVRVDIAAGKVAEAFACPGKRPHLLVAPPDESKLFVSHKEADVGVFDPKRGAFTGTIPVSNPAIASGNGSGSEGMAFTPDGARMVLVDNDKNDLHVIDTRSDREVARVPLNGHPLTNVKRSRLGKPLISPDGRHLVVTSYATALAWVIDGADYRKQAMVPLAKGPMGIIFALDGKSAVIASHDSGLLTRIDLATGRPVEVLDGGAGIEVLAYF